MNDQNTQDPAGSRGPTSPLALCKLHFNTAAKAPTFAEAAGKPTPSQQVAAKHGETGTSIASRQWQRQPGLALMSSHFEQAAKARDEANALKPTPAQMRAAHHQEEARRCEERSRQKSSAELIAEANRYAPGGHRGRLLTMAHFRQQEEQAAELMARELQAKAAAAAPQPAADAGQAGPWGRLTARIEKEGYTAEIRAEHDRLMALDAQKAATAPPATAASSPSPSRKRWDAFKAKVEARAAAAKPKRRAAARA